MKLSFIDRIKMFITKMTTWYQRGVAEEESPEEPEDSEKPLIA